MTRTSTRPLKQRASSVIKTLKNLADPDIAEHALRFFKTGPGDYGESDKFLGLRVPALRATAKDYEALSHSEIEKLLQSNYHEVRLCALFIMVNAYQRGDDANQQKLYDLYLANTSNVNNWDLVDSSAYHIVGPHLEHRSKAPLIRFAKSTSLWERRIAIISTLHYIRNRHYDTTLKLAKILLNDEQDLIHKAVGWMLREVGNRSRVTEDRFLEQYAHKMPRTMLRYAIEKYPKQRRQQLLRQ